VIIAAPFFGPEHGRHAERWPKLLGAWLDHVHAADTGAHVLLLTDGTVRIPPGVDFLHVDLRARFTYRKTTPAASVAWPHINGRAFDRKGALIAAALRILSDDLLVVDTDAFLKRDPTEELRAITHRFRNENGEPRVVGMVQDVDPRLFKVPSADAMRMRCAGVLWFPAVEAFRRNALLRSYATGMREADYINPGDEFAEQKGWSLAWHKLGGIDLPQTFNWTPEHLGPVHPGVFIAHLHGEQKWKHLGFVP
jgi:hypothetical protein